MNKRQSGTKGLLASVSALALSVVAQPAGADTPVSGNITTNTTWTTANSPYIVTGTVVVQGAASPVLTIQAGVTVKFNAGTSLQIGIGAAGNLSATGTSANPITLTANGSTLPGFWNGLQIMSQATSATQLTWVTVRYGGGGNNGGIRIQGAPTTLTNVTSQDHLFSAVKVESGSPVLTSCTLKTSPWGIYVTGGSPTLNTSTLVTANTRGGVYIATPGSASFQTASITSNTGYAISQSAKVTLGTVSSLTATGNTNNAIELRSDATVDVNTTWKAVGLIYVVTNTVNVNKGASATPVLTIPAGVTVKFVQNTGLTIGSGNDAELQANGTAAQPIVFTANTGSPTPGYWSGVQFWSHTTPTTKVSFATVSYSGYQGGIYVLQSSPRIENVTLQNNSVAAISSFQGNPTIINCSFSSNPAGVVNQTPSIPMKASLNYWNAASGPSGSGPGTGQSVSSGVVYEPWLIAAPTTANYLNTSTHTNRTFNPAITINTKIAAGSLSSASWTATILTGGGATVKTFTGTGTAWNVIWDGKNGSGVDQPDGTYTYQLQTGTATAAKGLTILDRTRQLTLTGLATAPAYFSPNADGVQDTALTTCSFNFDDVAWTLNVKLGITNIRTVTGNGPGISLAWDGKNDGGAIQPDNPYTISVSGIDGSASVNGTSGTTLDRTLPTATITSPAGGTTLSNVYQSGVTDVAVVGSATDTNMNNWVLDHVGFSFIATGTTNISASTIGTWSTLALHNQVFTVKLQVWDKAGNTSTVSKQYTVGNFKVALSSAEFNGSTGGTVTLTSTIPFAMTETLLVRNAAGQTVKTLVNAVSRSNPTYNDTWDGKNAGGVLQPDGAYFSVAKVTAGGFNMTWDLTGQPWNGEFYSGHSQSASWDPFNNQPLVLNYNFPKSGRVSIAFTPNADIVSNCPPPDFCVVFDRYEQAGPHTYYWAGTDSTGKYRADAKEVEVVMKRDTFPKNGIVLYGTKVVVTGVSAIPTSYSPAAGAQTIGFSLATYQSLSANVTITFLNQESMSVLRTISLPSQSAGPHTTTWDGRADNGMRVAPGTYLVTVSATDSVSNVGDGQIMTRVVF